MARRRVRVGKRRYAWVKWAIALVIALLVGLSFAISVAVGNWLLRTAEKYPAGDGQEQTVPEIPEEEILPVRVPAIKAHAYQLGDRYSGYVYAQVLHLCAPLRTEDGALAFDSAVCERAGWEANGAVDLAQNVDNLHHNNLYLTAYVPIGGFAEQDAALRELALSYEAALIAEAAEAGVDEIFLCGLAPAQSNIAEIVQYLRRVKALAGDCAIGVLVTPDVLLASRYDVYTAEQLLRVCDFLVLDMRGMPLHAPTEESGSVQERSNPAAEMSVEEVLQTMRYELTRYAPRLAFDGEQTDALDYVIEQNYGNWLIME